jgi:signal transduction histidine kinase
VIFSVTDFGIGIDKKNLSKLFSPFFRIIDHSGFKVDGLGLGLYLTRQIVEKHGGKIWVKSKIGKGSTFFFNIPLKIKSLD